MDEDERDYDQWSFLQALHELIDNPRAHEVDAVKWALAVQLCQMIAPDTEADFVWAREAALWIIKGLMLSIAPIWRETENVDTVMARIDEAIWPASRLE